MDIYYLCNASEAKEIKTIKSLYYFRNVFYK